MATEYRDLLQTSAKMINLAKKSAVNGTNIDERQIAELYGIYYNAFAGTLREGARYSKKMDVDGYPKITITINDNQYTCRDAALRDILKDEYDDMTRYPYEDTSASYVQPFNQIVYKEVQTQEAAPQHEERPKNTRRRPERNSNKESQEQLDVNKETLKEKNKQLKESARGFQYDPNYDHYYSEELPILVKELSSSSWKNAMRLTLMIASCAGIIATLAYL